MNYKTENIILANIYTAFANISDLQKEVLKLYEEYEKLSKLYAKANALINNKPRYKIGEFNENSEVSASFLISLFEENSGFYTYPFLKELKAGTGDLSFHIDMAKNVFFKAGIKQKMESLFNEHDAAACGLGGDYVEYEKNFFNSKSSKGYTNYKTGSKDISESSKSPACFKALNNKYFLEAFYFTEDNSKLLLEASSYSLGKIGRKVQELEQAKELAKKFEKTRSLDMIDNYYKLTR